MSSTQLMPGRWCGGHAGAYYARGLFTWAALTTPVFRAGGLLHQAIGLMCSFLDWPFRNWLVGFIVPRPALHVWTSAAGQLSWNCCGWRVQKGKLGSSSIAAVPTDPVADDAAECAKLWEVAAQECGVDP
jgi:hypothetical protein